MSSSKINGNKPFASKYLTNKSLCSNVTSRYKINEDSNYFGHINPVEYLDSMDYKTIGISNYNVYKLKR